MSHTNTNKQEERFCGACKTTKKVPKNTKSHRTLHWCPKCKCMNMGLKWKENC